MSTSGGFAPTSAPECPYAPRMTRAAALALRTAGGLKENCVVVITDGPTIGTAGNTSVTEMELNPVSPTELGTTARVHTTFAASAWPGVYDVDLGTAGTITRLTDDFGNTVSDVDADAPTVHTEWPWHLGSATFRDNTVNDSSLPGWGLLTAPMALISDNVITNATVDMIGHTTGTITFNRSILTGPNVVKVGDSALSITRSTITDGVYTLAGNTGLIQFHQSELLDVTCTRNGAAVSSFTINSSRMNGAFWIQNAGATVPGVGLAGTFVYSLGGVYTQNGPGRVSVSNCFMNNSAQVRNTAAATRGLQVIGCQIVGGVIEQQRSNGTVIDNVQRMFLNNATVTVAGAAGSAVANTVLTDGEMIRSAVVITDPTTTPTVQGCTFSGSALVNVNSGAQMDDCRIAHGATLTTTHLCDNAILEGGLPAFNKTTTGNNLGSLGNAGFDNWV